MTSLRLLVAWVFVWLGAWLLYTGEARAATLRVAVASNFIPAMNQLSDEFTATSGHHIKLSSASTGQLYAQIVHGAPYDVFMAADTDRPRMLLEKGLADHFKVYAEGQLVLLSNQYSGTDCSAVLTSENLKHLALANPDLAPYGLAAKQFLQARQLWQPLQSRLVMGENVAQATQMVLSKNATAGLLAQSMLVNQPLNKAQCLWPIPVGLYAPIEQAMVGLKRSQQPALLSEFMAFLQTEAALTIILSSGYLAPNDVAVGVVSSD